MAWVTDPDEIRRLLMPTRFCHAITDVDSLHDASMYLSSRQEEFSDYSTGIAPLVKKILDNPSERNEEGRSLVFLQVESPIVIDRYKCERPALVAVLLPDMLFQLCEVEATYQFSINEILDLDPCRDHFTTWKGCIFVDWIGTFMLLAQEHPSLLLALISSIILRNNDEGQRLREWLSGIAQSLRELVLITPEQVHSQCLEILGNARSVVAMNEEHEELTRILYDALDTILADEMFACERLNEKLVSRYCASIEGDGHEMLDECQTAWLDRYSKHIRHVCRRLEALIAALHGE